MPLTKVMLRILVVCTLCGIWTASAIPLTADSGNTQPLLTGAVGGTVNFAVYKNSGLGGPDPFGVGWASGNNFVPGTSSGTFDSSAQYLYVYETYNNGPNAAGFAISENTVALTFGLATSWGSFSSWSFVLVNGVQGVPAGFGDPSGKSTGVTPAVTNTVAGLISPTVSLSGSSIKADYAGFGLTSTSPESVIWGFTSNNPPIFVSTGVQDGGTNAQGTAPSPGPVPEPSSYTLLGAGALALLAGIRYRSGAPKRGL